MQWSVDLLDDAERFLLETVAVFTGGWTIEAAAQVAGLKDKAMKLALEGSWQGGLNLADDGTWKAEPR